ncbi:MAG: ABC transporter permease, partial [Betaproteobacteria bacterium]|nr:ABC transporter permease [Betaproteobacteria bacterium]
RAELERKLRLGKIEAVVELKSSGIEIMLNSANPDGRLAQLWIEDTIDKLNLAAAGVPPSYDSQVHEVAGRRNRYIDFALPGQIGMALISTAVFGTVFGLLYLKKALVLKRLFASPVRGVTILVGQGIARLVMAIFQAVVILVIGVFAFGFQLANGWVTFAGMLALATLGLLVFLGFGLFIAGRTANENAAGPIANLVTLPQFLLSGVFFPTDVFPSWLRLIADSLPLSHLNAAMRQLTIEGAGFVDLLPSLLALVAWGAVSYLAAARAFRWV